MGDVYILSPECDGHVYYKHPDLEVELKETIASASPINIVLICSLIFQFLVALFSHIFSVITL